VKLKVKDVVRFLPNKGDKFYEERAVRTCNRDKVMKIQRLGGCEDFVRTVSERSLYSIRSIILSQC